MEYFIGFMVLMFIYGWVANVVDERKEAKKKATLADIAKEVIGDFDIGKAKQSVLDTARKYSTGYKKCPQCSGILVPRKGVNGNFFGCSRYPMCRHTSQR